MRKIGLFAAAAALMAGPALAQYSPAPYSPTPYSPAPAPMPSTPAPMPQTERAPAATPYRVPSDYESQRTRESLRTRRSPGAPVDLGPNTPDANAAFMGGGVILEGPPGAPAPAPHAITTPPGPDGVVRGYMAIQRN